MKKTCIAIVLCVAILLSCPCSTVAKLHTGYPILDFDGGDGYHGDYVMMYNPDTDLSSSMSTGTLSGLIKTDVGNMQTSTIQHTNKETEAYRCGLLQRGECTLPEGAVEYVDACKSEPRVGDVRTFFVYNFDAYRTEPCDMRLSAIGDHCYVWEGIADSEYPLTQYSDNAIHIIKSAFDNKYKKVINAFGTYKDPEGFGRVNIVLYDVSDGIAGYFNPDDLYGLNNTAAIYIDTYPSILSQDMAGNLVANVGATVKSTLVHEFQHLIFESHTGSETAGNAPSWLNEMMSTAAEEIVYPGTATCCFIPSWSDDALEWAQNSDGNWTVSVPEDYPTLFRPLCGGGMYGEMTMGYETYYSYARVTMFGQYLFTQAGTNNVYKEILGYIESGEDDIYAIEHAMDDTKLSGMSISEIVKAFRLACIVNDSESYDCLYGFELQKGYEPIPELYNMENPFDIISIGTYSGKHTEIKAGGFLVVKPIGGVYTPPDDADNGLEYVGIRISGLNNLQRGDVNADGEVNTGDAVTILRYYVGLTILSNVQIEAADMNIDDSVNTGDVVTILRYCLET